MSPPEISDGLIRVRREPPAFRRVVVRRVEFLTPYMARVALTGQALKGFSVDLAAASVRLLLPAPETETLVIPIWNGNEFLLSDGMRPTIRTFTPQRVDAEALELNLDVVIHSGGAASEWAGSAVAGDPAGVSGPGRGYSIDTRATRFLLAGDESAIPAISQLLEAIPVETEVQTIIEIAHPDARLSLPDHPRATIEWCDWSHGTVPGSALMAAVVRSRLDAGTRVWAAGEAAAMHRVRRHLFEDRGLARQMVTARGYWKHGRRTNTADNE
jgi:NADPH-dependent ferric siderophore reductase